MADMRLSAEEKKDFSTPSLAAEAPKYPHGLTIHLGPEELKKLGFLSAPKLDDVLMLLGRAVVSEVSKDNGSEDSGQLDFHVRLQITELEVKGEEKQPNSPSKIIYGE
jgi:hypothetical protein